MGPHYVGLLFGVHYAEIASPAHQFIDQSRIVALVNEYFQLLFSGKNNSTDVIARQHVLQKDLLMCLLLIKQGSLPFKLGSGDQLLPMIVLARIPAVKLCSNEVEEGLFVGEAAFQVPFVFGESWCLEDLRKLYDGFLFSKVGASVLARDRSFGGGGRADGVILLAKLIEIVSLFGTSLFHRHNKML